MGGCLTTLRSHCRVSLLGVNDMKSDNKLALFFRKIGKRLKEDKVYSRTFYSIIAVLVALIVVIIVAISCSKKEDGSTDGENTPDEVSQNEAPDSPDYTVPDVALEEDAYADVNALVNQYFAAMTTGDTAAITAMKDTAAQEDLIKIEKESAYIDEFDNIKVYTKPGPLTNSYVTFAYYEIKFKDINTLDDVPNHKLLVIKDFFETYKRLQKKEVKVGEFKDTT